MFTGLRILYLNCFCTFVKHSSHKINSLWLGDGFLCREHGTDCKQCPSERTGVVGWRWLGREAWEQSWAADFLGVALLKIEA